MDVVVPSPFEEEDVAALAADRDLDATALTEALAAHQSSVADLPGVENLVYEWRKHYADPLVERTESTYYVVVPETVWAEFGERLGLGDETVAALREVHRRTVTRRDGVPENPPDGQAYVALDRTADGSSDSSD